MNYVQKQSFIVSLLRKTIQLIEHVSRFFFLCACICLLLLIAITVQQVICRYLFQSTSIALQELEWHLFGFVITMSMAETLRKNAHVRVDILSSRFHRDLTRWIHIIGYLLLLPLCLTLAGYGLEDVVTARSFAPQAANVASEALVPTNSPSLLQSGEYIWREIQAFIFRGEGSPDPGGLGARWIIRSAFPVGMILLALQSLALLLTHLFPSLSDENSREICT